MLKSIDGEEMHVHLECEYERLGKRLEVDPSEFHLHYYDFRRSLNLLFYFWTLIEIYFPKF